MKKPKIIINLLPISEIILKNKFTRHFIPKNKLYTFLISKL